MALSKNNWYGIILAAVLVALGIASYHIKVAQKAEKEQAMVFQLKQLREAVQIFAKTQKAMPSELKAALVVSIDGKAVPIQWSFQKDAKGNPVDPFGALYQFNMKTGWVKSGTQGYESW